MDKSTDIIDLCGGGQPVGNPPNSGRSNKVVTDTKKQEDLKEEITKLKHSRLNLLGEAKRCNSVSLPDRKKRKIGDTSLDTSLLEPYKQNEAIEKNKNLVQALEKLVEELPNTNKKIKELTKMMTRNVKEFEREVVVQWMEKHKHEPIEKITFDSESQTQLEKKSTAEISTQTDPWHGGQQTLRTLEGIDNLEQYRQVGGMNWERTLFKKTEVRVGNPLATDDQTTKVVLIEPNDQDMNLSVQRLYKEKFPELSKIKNEFEVIEQITKIKAPNDTTELSTKKVIKAAHNGTMQDIWEKLTRVREETLMDKKSGNPPH